MAVRISGSPRATAAALGPDVDVLVLIDNLACGGAQMLLSQFAAAAPAVGIRLSVACLTERAGNPAATRLQEAGIPALNLEAMDGRPGPRSVQRVRRHIAAVKPDIVHTHLGASDWIGGLAARSLRIPVVCTIHTEVWDKDRKTDAKRLLVNLCAARVVAVSESTRRAYDERHWARDGQLTTIHNGVDVSSVSGSGREVRREFGWDDDDLVVGMISSLRPEKAHDVAIAAFGLLRDEFPALRLLIVGEGPTAGKIAGLAREFGHRVAMTGLRSDVMRCFDACDICLHPSRADAFPTTLIEAMSAGVPIVATRVGGIPEIVAHDETGVLVPAPPTAESVAAALGALARDPSRRRALGTSARNTYRERLTAGRWAQGTRAMYDSVLAERGRQLRGRRQNGAWPFGPARR